MAIQVGDHVRVLPPFGPDRTLKGEALEEELKRVPFPGVYTVDAAAPDGVTFTIFGDRGFDVKFLEVTADPVTDPSPIPPPLPPPDAPELAARVAALEELLVKKAVVTAQEVTDTVAAKEASGKLALDEVNAVEVIAVADVKVV